MPNHTDFDANMGTAELTITRVFNAPPAQVFAAWSSEAALKKWWGPRAYPVTQSKLDFREGGFWHYAMTGPEGDEHWGKQIYEQIDEPNRIVYTDHFSDAEGNFDPNLPTMQISITFESVGDGKTKLTSYTKLASAADLQKLVDMGMREGILETWDFLEDYLEGRR